MTFKKKEASTVVEDIPVAQQEEIPAYALKPKLCGHINRQFINADGVREDLKCTLPDGHVDDHAAPYQCLRPVDGSIKQAKAVASGKPILTIGGKQFVEVTEAGEWSDGASIPVEQIKPDSEQLAQIKQKKGDVLDAANLARKLG